MVKFDQQHRKMTRIREIMGYKRTERGRGGEEQVWEVAAEATKKDAGGRGTRFEFFHPNISHKRRTHTHTQNYKSGLGKRERSIRQMNRKIRPKYMSRERTIDE